jgi:hypothetical protein
MRAKYRYLSKHYGLVLYPQLAIVLMTLLAMVVLLALAFKLDISPDSYLKIGGAGVVGLVLGQVLRQVWEQDKLMLEAFQADGRHATAWLIAYRRHQCDPSDGELKQTLENFLEECSLPPRLLVAASCLLQSLETGPSSLPDDVIKDLEAASGLRFRSDFDCLSKPHFSGVSNVSSNA